MNRFFVGSEIQKGYGFGKIPHVQVGHGFGGLFSKFFDFVKPYLKKAKDFAIPLLKSGAETVGKEVVKTAAEIAKDVLDGKNLKESAKQHFTSSVDNLASKAEQVMSGKGYKRRYIHKKLPSKKKKRELDIFD